MKLNWKKVNEKIIGRSTKGRGYVVFRDSPFLHYYEFGNASRVWDVVDADTGDRIKAPISVEEVGEDSMVWVPPLLTRGHSMEGA